MSQIAGHKKKILFFLFMAFLSVNILLLSLNLKEVVNNGLIRKNILYQVKSFYPDLPNEVLVYTESDTAYYGLSEKIMPFQSGFGQTLLVWYYFTESFPKEFFTDGFLWEITSQGYKKSGSRGFGYFRDYQLLLRTMQDYKLSTDSVISFSWNSKYNTIINTTQQIRKKINNLR